MALAALEQLTPATHRQVRELIGSDSAFASAAVWADEVRPALPATAPWHFVNVPLDATGYDRARDCSLGDCVVEALRYFRGVLADSTAPRGVRVEALKFPIPFVGDLHQPLHVGERGDRGGNDYAVTFRGRQTNLHSVWDSGLLDWAEWSEEPLVAELVRRGQQLGPANDDLDQWTAESHRLSREYAYPDAGQRRLASDFARPRTEIAVTQLARSAQRLAILLNRTLDPATRAP
jgi:hypothetical protein